MGSQTKVRAEIGYTAQTGKRPYFYANAHEKDYVPLAPAEMDIADARGLETTLDREGFVLVQHSSTLSDLTDMAALASTHSGEIAELLTQVTGAHHVSMTPRGILRYSERSGKTGSTDNSHPARFAHVDMSHAAAADARAKAAPGPEISEAGRSPAARNTMSGASSASRRKTCRWRCVPGPACAKRT